MPLRSFPQVAFHCVRGAKNFFLSLEVWYCLLPAHIYVYFYEWAFLKPRAFLCLEFREGLVSGRYIINGVSLIVMCVARSE